MTARLPAARPDGESQVELRRDSARVLHEASLGISKAVGGALGVTASRIRKMTNAEAANPLELLSRWIDRLEREGVDPELIDTIPAFLADRRGFDLAPRSEATAAPLARVDEIGGRILERAGKAVAELVDTFLDGRQTEAEYQANRKRLQEVLADIYRAGDFIAKHREIA